MNCETFERWLNDGLPVADAAAARAHVAGCPRCAAALHAAETLDRALRERFAFAPAFAPEGFTARVLERIARGDAARRLLLVFGDAMPWWVRAAAEPAAALACVLAALVLWQGAALFGAAHDWATRTTLATPEAGAVLAWLTQAFAPVARGFAAAASAAPIAWTLALAAAAVPILLLVSAELFRAAERSVVALRPR